MLRTQFPRKRKGIPSADFFLLIPYVTTRWQFGVYAEMKACIGKKLWATYQTFQVILTSRGCMILQWFCKAFLILASINQTAAIRFVKIVKPQSSFNKWWLLQKFLKNNKKTNQTPPPHKSFSIFYKYINQ